MDTNTKEIAKLLGSLGGKKTAKKYGTEHYRKLAELAHQARKANTEAKKKTAH